MRNLHFPRSNVLVLGSDSVYSLLPSTLIAQVEALLESHRVEDAVNMAEQQRKKLQSKLTMDDDEACFQCLIETLFDDAGRHLYDGNLDPRALISYYPELCGSLFSSNDELNLFAGVAERMPKEASIDDIIAANLVLNYSPHLSPNTKSSPPAVELRGVLKLTAVDMLKLYLKKWRKKRRLDNPGPSSSKAKTSPEMRVVDTVLAKLFADAGESAELNSLIDDRSEIVLAEVEPVLIRTGNIESLCRIYRQRGEIDKLLDTWSKLVTKELSDLTISDPLTNMFALLTEKKDRALAQHWGVWLTKQDSERALKLLTTFGVSKRGSKPQDDQALLKQIQDANPSAGTQFLEHLILSKRNQDPALHDQLASICVDQLLACLEDESISKLWRAKAASYASSRQDSSFLSYFASTTPDSDSKRSRLKTIMFLQASDFYDVPSIQLKLQGHEKILGFEMAIVEGKAGHDKEALSLLVHTVNDSSSAEAYCTLGGDIIPAKIAQSLGERFGLQQWASLFVPVVLPGKSKATSQGMKRELTKTVDESRKRELTRILLEVYMKGGETMVDRTAALLNAQAMNLDASEVLCLVPPTWPLQILSTFLTRSFRRTLHTRHELLLVKGITFSENMAVSDKTWTILREEGAIVEEAVDDEDGDVEGEKLEEKMVVDGGLAEGLGLELNEKAAIHAANDVVDIEVEGDDGGLR
ncbi:Vam6/VPS39/TRAP1 family protein [Abortiporus biennis]